MNPVSPHPMKNRLIWKKAYTLSCSSLPNSKDNMRFSGYVSTENSSGEWRRVCSRYQETEESLTLPLAEQMALSQLDNTLAEEPANSKSL